MINRLYISILFCSLSTLANEVSLSIVNQGQINYGENSCQNQNCIVSTEISAVTLIPQNAEPASFSHWSEQQCDFGKGAIFETNEVSIGHARRGAKTLQAIDINNDGAADLVGINLFAGSIIQYINDGEGNFEQATIIQNLGYPAALDSYDWNGDGYQDILISEFTRGLISIYANDGNGHFSHLENISIVGVNPYAFSVIDINQDTQPDLIISSFVANAEGNLRQLVESIKFEDTAIFINKNGEFTKHHSIAQTASITLDSYFDDQNVLQIISAEIAEGHVSLYSGNETFTKQVLDSSTAPYGVAFYDLDNDGDQDVFAAHYQPFSLRVAFANSATDYQTAEEVATGFDGLTATAAGDFNLDGLTDIATGEFNAHEFRYLPMKSYVGCGFNKGARAKVTANFITQEGQPSDNSNNKNAEIQIESSSSQSNGGSFSIWLLILCSAARYLRTRY